jgi:hypothetical protein
MLNAQFHLFQEAINQFTAVIVLENTNQINQGTTEAEGTTEVQDIPMTTEAEGTTEVQDIPMTTEVQDIQGTTEMVVIENKQL